MANGNGNIGKRVGGYRLVKELGAGSFGSVYKGEHTIFDGNIAAVKLLHARFATQKERDKFIEEARLHALLKHTYILPIINAGIDDNEMPYLITEYAPGGTLRNLIENDDVPKPLPLEKVLSTLIQIGQALQFAHDNNIVHRDVKPENILFNAQGDAVLADFGIAEILNMYTHVMGKAGTPQYMAPEVFAEKAWVESDQYSLGCIAYELFTGQMPFEIHSIESAWYQHAKVEPTPPTQHNPHLPLNIEQAILKAMAKDRKQRHANVNAFIVALQKTAQKWFEEGKAFYHAGDYARALVAFDKVIALDANNWKAWHSKGEALRNRNRHQKALDAYEVSTQLNQKYVWSWYHKGEMLRKLGRNEEAIAAYEQALKLKYNVPNPHAGKGAALHNLKRFDEALEEFEIANEIDPRYVWAWRHKGSTLRDQGKNKEALTAYERALEIDPDYANDWHNKAIILERLAQEAHDKAKEFGYKT